MMDKTAETALHAMSEAHDSKAWDRCVEVGDAWLEARGAMPVLASVWYAQSLMGVGRFDDAVRWAEVAALKMPRDEKIALCAARSTYAQALSRVGRFSHARKVLKDMTAVPVDHPETLEKQGHILLATSDKWRQGWSQHEARLTDRPMPDGLIQWDGKKKGTIGVLHEQGIGDAVLFARWMDWVAEVSGNTVVWFGPEDVLSKWIGELPNVRVGSRGVMRTPVDYAVWSMSLPFYANVQTPRDIPRPVAPTALLEKRQHRARNSKLRVGVCWKGSAGGWHDFERSFTYEQFQTILAPHDEIEFVNLAHEAVTDDRMEPVVFDDIYECAEAMLDLDLVVSVDTSVVHVAGSLGIPTLAIVPTVPDWRYQWPRGGGSPFYRSVTVVRRKRADDLHCLNTARRMIEKYAGMVRKIEARAA